jgi:fatty acid desaturase
MTQVDTKKALSNPLIRAQLLTNNLIAVQELTLRVSIEVVLICLVYYSLEGGMYIFSLFFYYILAVWHSFWGYAGIGHELMHGKVFSNRRVNKVLYHLSSILVWSNASFFIESHLQHHSKTFFENDFEAKGIRNWGLVNLCFYLTFDFPAMMRKFFYTIVNSMGLKYVNRSWCKISMSHQMSAISILFFQLLIGINLYYLTDNIFYNFLFLLLPFTGQLINKLLSQSQHMGLENYRELGPLKHSRSIRLPKLFTFLYAGMNYHAEHHLIPSIPYYNLRKVSDLIVINYDHQVVDWMQFYKHEFISVLRNK